MAGPYTKSDYISTLYEIVAEEYDIPIRKKKKRTALFRLLPLAVANRVIEAYSVIKVKHVFASFVYGFIDETIHKQTIEPLFKQLARGNKTPKVMESRKK